MSTSESPTSRSMAGRSRTIIPLRNPSQASAVNRLASSRSEHSTLIEPQSISVSDNLIKRLKRFGRVVRIGGPTPADNAVQVAAFVGRLRSQPFANAFQRAPGIAESVEWAKALVALDTLALDPEVVTDTAGILFKQREDVAALTHELATELLKPEPEEA